MVNEFQSAPLTEARGDVWNVAPVWHGYRFQSAPLTEARGDSSSRSLRVDARSFNPLPLPKQGETYGAPFPHTFDQVSIRSPYRSKGRWKQYRPHETLSCFNPLPLPKQGETSFSKRFSMSLKVSIRSPYRSKGRHLANMLVDPLPRFQSAPLTEARGDQAHRRHLQSGHGFNPLPLPKQGETFWDFSQRRMPKHVSIRSPYRSKGRHHALWTSPW